MTNTRNVSKDCEKDVDEQIHTEAALQQDSNGREQDSKDDFDNVAASHCHDTIMLKGKV